MHRFKAPDEFYNNPSQWHDELLRLREVLQQTSLDETIKWGVPCYTHNGKNIVGVAAMKNFFALWFHQGALLKDPKNVLMNAQEGVTKAQRQMRMTSMKDIKATVIKAYVKEAISLQEAGKEIKADRNKPVVVPAELKAALAKNKKAHAAFSAMPKGKQREYAEHISSAKRDETKQTRLKKIVPMIVSGVGLNDKYRNC
ncbi:MAG: YdeI/OmpD-associated family protein [Phycisphaeraceae bacterium]|nr:YdeI/OmpD-associated family protein [Phycisphaerales bacterium]MCB9859207.1 YdeI/OmpD-associated family protein [Phycisphaeraceae bacterium]